MVSVIFQSGDSPTQSQGAENLDNPYRSYSFVAPKGEKTAEKKKRDAWRNNADKAGHSEPSRISPC